MRAWMQIVRGPRWRWSRIAFGSVRFPYCTQAESENQDTPTLKAELRRLFKLIHPDHFHNQPEEQAINQRSFQLLQEYLNAAKGHDRSRHFAYHFVFFIRQDENLGNLKKVEVSLPPPQVQYHPERGAEILSNTQTSLSRLLSACGLSGNVSGGLISEEDRICLSDLLQQASEIQRRNEGSAHGLEQQLAAVKNALSLGRGIRVAFRAPVSDMSIREQMDSLEKLACALDIAQDVKLHGHTVLIGDCYGVDALGYLWLRHNEDIQSWSNFFQTTDMNKATRNRKDAAIRQLLELKAARLMEVEMIFTHDALAVQPDYLIFLNRIVDEAEKLGAVGAGKFSQLPIRVTGPKKELGTGGEDGIEANESVSFIIDQTLGYIAVPVWETLTNTYRFIEQRGEEALRIRCRVKQSEEQVERLKMIVRKKLRLRHLTFDKRLRSDQCLAACMRLIHFAPELDKYMEGLSVCISNEHRLPLEGAKSFLHLKWNFSLMEL